MSRSSQIYYFETEGRDNLPEVIRVLKTYIKKNWSADDTPILVFFTAQGEGPALAYQELSAFDPKIIAITFPPDFSVKSTDNTRFSPQISRKLKQFFDGVGIPVIAHRLPFDGFDPKEMYSKEMNSVVEALGLFGGSVPLAVQAVLQACDAGLIEVGQTVFAITGDCALLVSASNSRNFLTKDKGLAILEILCKARGFTIQRKPPQSGNPPTIEASIDGESSTDEYSPKELK